MSTDTQEAPNQTTTFDDEYYHVADGPPYITTLCGLDVRGQQPTANPGKESCPICDALVKYYL